MARVLVELDIHVGLMEYLELEWRGQVMLQRLDYLGIPFQCSHCRQTRHLRKDCSNWFGVGGSGTEWKNNTTDLYMSEEENAGLDTYSTDIDDATEGKLSGTLIGKLRSFCPNFYSKLSAWERDFLENSVTLNTVTPFELARNF
jgi:hypothetical protein